MESQLKLNNGFPGFPTLPGSPSFPGMSDFTGSPQFPSFPGMPDFPGMPSAAGPKLISDSEFKWNGYESMRDWQAKLLKTLQQNGSYIPGKKLVELYKLIYSNTDALKESTAFAPYTVSLSGDDLLTIIKTVYRSSALVLIEAYASKLDPEVTSEQIFKIAEVLDSKKDIVQAYTTMLSKHQTPITDHPATAKDQSLNMKNLESTFSEWFDRLHLQLSHDKVFITPAQFVNLCRNLNSKEQALHAATLACFTPLIDGSELLSMCKAVLYKEAKLALMKSCACRLKPEVTSEEIYKVAELMENKADITSACLHRHLLQPSCAFKQQPSHCQRFKLGHEVLREYLSGILRPPLPPAVPRPAVHYSKPTGQPLQVRAQQRACGPAVHAGKLHSFLGGERHHCHLQCCSLCRRKARLCKGLCFQA